MKKPTQPCIKDTHLLECCNFTQAEETLLELVDNIQSALTPMEIPQ